MLSGLSHRPGGPHLSYLEFRVAPYLQTYVRKVESLSRGPTGFCLLCLRLFPSRLDPVPRLGRLSNRQSDTLKKTPFSLFTGRTRNTKGNGILGDETLSRRKERDRTGRDLTTSSVVVPVYFPDLHLPTVGTGRG